jgi:hypothetical protein
MVQDVMLPYHENIITHVLAKRTKGCRLRFAHLFTLDQRFDLLFGWTDWRRLCDLPGSVAEAEVTVTKEHVLVHCSPTLLGPWRMQLAHPHASL